jgi:hypothetical protein
MELNTAWQFAAALGLGMLLMGAISLVILIGGQGPGDRECNLRMSWRRQIQMATMRKAANGNAIIGLAITMAS